MAQLTNANARETAKQDRSGARTAEDVVRRIPDMDKVVITAKQIEMEGYTSINGGFKIDQNGNMECSNATITGSSLTINSIEENPKIQITSVNSSASPYADLFMYGYGYQVKDNTSDDIYAELFTYGNRDYEIVPHSELYLGSIWNNRTIILDGLLGDISTEGEILSVNGVCQGSRAELKKDFEKLDNALDIVKDVDIYKYHLKDQEETDKKHIGFVIGDNFKYREEITSKNNDGAELYSMISVLWKAIQEQQKEIEELRKLVENDKN